MKNQIFIFFLLVSFFNNLSFAEDYCQDKETMNNTSKLVSNNGLNGNFIGCASGLAGPSYESTDGSIHVIDVDHKPVYFMSLSKQRNPLLCLVIGSDGKLQKRNSKVCKVYQEETMNKFFPK